MQAQREFDERDFDELVARWHECNRASYPYVRAHQEHTLDDARAFFRASILAHCRVLVAEQQGELAGVLALEAPWVRQLAVFTSFRRCGIGTLLIRHAQALSPDELRLHTFGRNTAARAFYERLGFAPIAFGVSPAPESEPDVEYHWRRIE